MKVILLKDVRGIGQIHEVHSVSDGYAMNFLFPNKLAEAATPDKLAAFEAYREKEQAAQKERTDAAAAHIRALSGVILEIPARATEKGGLFKAIHESTVARALKEQKDANIEESQIFIQTPIKTVGEHAVELRSAEVRAKITVKVVPQN